MLYARLFVDVPGTPSLLQIKADNAAANDHDHDASHIQMKCFASTTTSKPSRLAPVLQYLWVVDGQPLHETDSNTTSIAVARDSRLSYRCMTREAGSRLQSLPSNEMKMLPDQQRSSCDACEFTAYIFSVFDNTIYGAECVL